MHAKDVAKLLGGSIAVYVVMAACSAAVGPQGFAPDAGSNGVASPRDGSSGGESGSGVSFDALTDPIPTASANPNQSGTRLKASYYAGADGSKQFASWHDSQRNEDCYFQTAADGTTRCMPIAAAASYFADSKCTQPLALIYCFQPQPKYLSSTYSGVPSAPPAGVHLFQLGGAMAVTTIYEVTSVVTADGGVCSSGQATYACTAQPPSTLSYLQSVASLYSVGPELQPDAFVQATMQTEP